MLCVILDYFEQILACIHFDGNESLVQDKKALGYNKMGKCRWLIKKIVRRAKVAYNCDRYLACNEIMVPYRS